LSSLNSKKNYIFLSVVRDVEGVGEDDDEDVADPPTNLTPIQALPRDLEDVRLHHIRQSVSCRVPFLSQNVLFFGPSFQVFLMFLVTDFFVNSSIF
jgi:hypothetical protein